MLDFLLTYCTDCSNLEEVSCKLDGVLAQYGKNSWANISYMTNKATPYVKIRELMYYRDILDNLKWNQAFYLPYTMQQIVARVGAIVGGEETIQKRVNLTPFVPHDYTTTTSTTTSTSTSTTSTSTSTTSSSTTTTTTT